MTPPQTAAPVDEQGGPIFIVGTMRSGSTLLRLIIDSHPRVAATAETGFMGALMAAKAIPNWKHGHDWFHLIDWDDAEFDDRLREFYGGMFERFAAAQGKARWSEKTPFHTAHMLEMGRVFPDAQFVGIVRHPGAVATSLRKNFHYTFEDALSYWTATNLDMIRAAAQLGDRFALCRYEDVVTGDVAVLRELVGFIGEPWVEEMAQHHRVQRAKSAPRLADGGTNSWDAVDAERAGRWMASLSAADREALGSTEALGGFFGYAVVDSDRLEPLLASDGTRRWLPRGTELAARRAQWCNRVDFDAKPPAPSIDADPAELAARLLRAEQALTRIRARRLVKLGDAIRRVQHGRSLADVRAAWATLRPPRH